MKNKTKYCLGVMSGTSLDGLDIAYLKIDSQTSYQFEILKAVTIPYNPDWKNMLKNGFHISGEALTKLDADYGIYLGNTLKKFITENNIENLDFIASHGHTIYHNPSDNYTLQIGNGPYINTITGIKTICDFRTQDVALGGQGAPLVPIGDALLFSEYDYCLNLGGFSNISMNKNNQRIAFDICPVNIVMNHYVNSLDLEYDENGEIASKGNIDTTLLNELNSLPFYNDSKPKSLGYEFILETIFPIINKYNLEIKDILRTFVEHIAQQIAKKIASDSSKRMLITGGGAFNIFLIERLKEFTKTELIIPENSIIDYKEALVFALLGYLKDEEKNNCLKSVTGASKDHSSGIIYTS
ncbi:MULTISPECIES: anhydro-N-acetylmuramic acid kinase [Flavobacteriaceae]|uniref:Anhydro-N-acetylmuramic acid kinase n=2 Tax=Flavobacteriaceae TaxID=49546 RepID=A0A4Y8AUQ3_9FLAO|nr:MULTISPECIES: anhydro-N-acetylmuramic acid kinase [Flavobacteriaceae]TEW75096.1 anhydro-N-acetylmuramic acid kinase [Gramella jeungdoensis]GGK41605.1 anhydro-N-acetylmuramic acid kinase [Lutibacter litoralis]